MNIFGLLCKCRTGWPLAFVNTECVVIFDVFVVILLYYDIYVSFCLFGKIFGVSCVCF